tara:strand:- start:391 stop:594 length:204 start_codon:yes stop_codon:yes gene_type:complete
MSGANDKSKLSATVSQVLGSFTKELRADEKIDNGAVDRLEALILAGSVPKPEEIAAAMFPEAAETEK